MGTRATLTVTDGRDTFDLYQHYDGYPDGPHGIVRHLDLARHLAWPLPRFEAGDFAAAIIAVLKDRGGTSYLTRDAEAHGDRSFHYRVEGIREGVTTRILLTISRPGRREDRPMATVFSGSIDEAITRFDALPETSGLPREWQILAEAEGALHRADEDIGALCGHLPEGDTNTALNGIQDAIRDLTRLRFQLEKADPWSALKGAEALLQQIDHMPPNLHASTIRTEVRQTMDTHRRFQRDTLSTSTS